MELIQEARLFPCAVSGRGLAPARAVQAWATAAWLLSVEGRAYLEDLEGGADQPDLREVVRLRLLELLFDIDEVLAGHAPAADGHQLALALEYGLQHVGELPGPTLAAIFTQAEEIVTIDRGIEALWERLCAEFPGELPNPLVASGQRAILRALRAWNKLCAAARSDASFLEPLLKDA